MIFSGNTSTESSEHKQKPWERSGRLGIAHPTYKTSDPWQLCSLLLASILEKKPCVLISGPQPWSRGDSAELFLTFRR